MTELYNATSFLDSSSIVEGVGVPPILIMGIMLIATFIHTRNTTYMIFVGAVFIGIGMALNIENIHYIFVLLVGIFTINIITNRTYDGEIFSRRRRHDISHPNTTFIKRVMLVLGLAHRKREKENE